MQNIKQFAIFVRKLISYNSMKYTRTYIYGKVFIYRKKSDANLRKK